MRATVFCLLILGLSLGSQTYAQGQVITTVAGGGNPADGLGDGGPATSAGLYAPYAVAVDASGNLFIADAYNQRIRKVTPAGIISTVAGSGVSGTMYGGFSGDGGLATAATLNYPDGIAVDSSGNLFIADARNHRVREVTPDGTIRTIAGNGTAAFAGDGGQATSASLQNPAGIALDSSGNLYIADMANNRIRKVTPAGIISTLAGSGATGVDRGNFSGDGGAATSATLNNPHGVYVDSSGNLFIADTENNRIREVTPAGIISTVAGDGVSSGSPGDFGTATSASLSWPFSATMDAGGDLLIADSFHSAIRKLAPNGLITKVAGNYYAIFAGDGNAATLASLSYPYGIAVDSSGNIYIADTSNNRIREVLAKAPLVTVSPGSFSPSLILGATSTQQVGVTCPVAGLAWSATTSTSWIVLKSNSGTTPGALSFAINPVALLPGTYTGTISISNPLASPTQETVTINLTVTGPTATISVAPGTISFQLQQGFAAPSQSLQIGGTAGTAWQATAATATGGAWLSVSATSGQIPATLTVQAIWTNQPAGTYQGSITFQAPANPPSTTVNVTLTVTAGSGIITTVAGNGIAGFSGDGGPATSAELDLHMECDGSVAVDASGNIFIADCGNSRIRKVSAASGIITTAATGLYQPFGVTVDASGNLFIADTKNNRVQKVSAAGVATTVAGNGIAGFSGDGGPAASAQLNWPMGVAVDTSGNLFIADETNNRIRRVSASGVITTIAGSGGTGVLDGGFSGDGGPATSAQLAVPHTVAVDGEGNLFIADSGNCRIRKLSGSGIITTVAGTSCGGFGGDGGPATSAALSSPEGVAVDAAGNVFIADTVNNRIRRVSANGTITTVAGSQGTGYSGDGGLATLAKFYFTSGVAVDASGNIYVADEYNSRVRKVTGASKTGPSIAAGGIVPADSTVNTIQPGEWVSIYGTNLTSSSAAWNGDFPTSLGGTSVTIDGKLAYLSFVSPGQINLQVPNDTAIGPVPVVVTTAGGGATSTVTLAQFGPSFFLLDAKHVAGIIVRSNGSGANGGGAYDILGPTGTSLGYPTVAAKAGDIVELYGTGFGPTNPAVPAGQVFSGAAPTTNPVKLLINNVSVTPMFAGLSGAGLDQINLTIPAGLGTGDVSLVATLGGVQTPTGIVISLR